MVTIEEYRRVFHDQSSTDEQIKARLDYLEGFCRNLIKAELQTYVDTNQSKRTGPGQSL